MADLGLVEGIREQKMATLVAYPEYGRINIQYDISGMQSVKREQVIAESPYRSTQNVMGIFDNPLGNAAPGDVKEFFRFGDTSNTPQFSIDALSTYQGIAAGFEQNLNLDSKYANFVSFSE